MFRKKKPRFGLEEDFREVKTAGYTATKKVKRDKSVNRRAGLHDKLKYLQGEARVKRCKPLAVKHVRRLRKVAALCSIGVVGLVAVFGVGFLAPARKIQLEGEFETVCYETPTDGSKPTDHTLVENVGYMNYVLKNQLFWSSKSTSNVDAVALGVPAKQSVDNYKQYYNGVLISADCAFSSVSESMQYGEQFCQIENAVLSRYSTSNKTEDLQKGMDAPWSTGPATGMTLKAFRSNRGNPPLEFSVYVLNENTIANAGDYTVVDNQDGTYSMSLTLNVNTGVDLTSADYYYRLQMQINGGLNDLPTIYSTTVTYTFDESWRVLKLEVDDDYKVTALGMPSNCTSHTETNYFYSEEGARNTFWEDYFRAEYERQKDSLSDDAVIDKEESLTAMGCLATAFGSVLSEGAVFKVDLGLENFTLNGAVCIEMQNSKLSGLSAKLGDILVWLDGNTLYITDGTVKYKADIGSFLSSGDKTEEGGARAQGLSDGLNLNDLMNQMTSGEFNYNEETGVATLESQVELFGLKIPLNFEFQKTESGVSLNFLKAEIALGEKTVNADLRFGNESDKPSKPADTAGYTDILNDGVTLDISLILDELKLDGFAKIIMQKGKFGGVYATLGDFGVYYDCPHNMLYISAGNAKYKLDISKLGTGNFDASEILKLINLDELLANLTTGETNLGTSLDWTVLEKVLTAAIDVNLGGGIKLGANVAFENLNASLTATLVNKTVTLPTDLNTYTDILNGDITLDVSLTLLTGLADTDGNRNSVVLAGKVALCLQDGKLTEVRADFGDLAVYYEFAPNEIYIKIGETKAKIAIGTMELGALSSISLFSEGGDGFDLPAVVSDLLQNLVATGKIISSNVDLSVIGSVIPVWADISLDGGVSVKAGLSLLGIDAVAQVGVSAETLEALSEEEKKEYTDVLKDGWNIADGLLGEHISATVSGTVYSYTDEYKDKDLNNIKYNFNATLDYDKGHTVNEEGETVPNTFPVHIDKGIVNKDGNRTGVNFYVDSSLYLHFGLALEATKPTQDSLYLDLWLLDADPATDDKGITTADAPGKNDELDVYIKISKYKEAGKAYPVYDKDGNKKLDAKNNEITVVGEPLCLYAPVSEIMTLVSMVGAAADLHGLTFKDSAELTKLASDIADIVDQLLISNYLPHTHDQFASLGNSLIPQILGMNLNDMLNKLIGSAGTVVVGASDFNLDFSKEYVKSLTYGDNTLALTLNSALLFGEDVNDDMSVTLEKSPVNGVDYLSAISLKNLYTDNNTKKIDLGLNLNYGEIARPAQMDGFMNLSGADTLLKALVNSATHPKDSATDKEKEVFGEKNLPDYILNHYYYIEGSITATLNIVDLIKPEVKLDIVALSVTIDEETNEVGINVRVHYKELAANAANMADIIAIDGESYVDLTLKGGMLYLTRTQLNKLNVKSGLVSWITGIIGYDIDTTDKTVTTFDTPLVTHRVYNLATMSSNLNDIMDLVGYIFNLNEKVMQNVVMKSLEGSVCKCCDACINGDCNGACGCKDCKCKPPADYSGYDYGKLLKTYLTSFCYYDDGNGKAEWKVALCGQFITDLLGMTTSDPAISFLADYTVDKDGNKSYVVSGLQIHDTTINFVDGVQLSMTVNGNLEYCNPRLEMKDGFKDVTSDSSLLWEEVFGCVSKEIPQTELWGKALGVLGKTYLAVDMSNANAPVKLGDLKFTLEGEPFGEGKKVLYTDTEVLSDFVMPNFPERNGYALNTVFDPSSATFNAGYVANNYTLNIDYGTPEYASEIIDYTYGNTFDVSPYLGKTYIGLDGATYKLKGFALNGVIYSAGNSIISDKALAGIYCKDLTLTAVWENVGEVRVTLNSTVGFSYTGYDGTYTQLNLAFKDGINYAVADATAEGYTFLGWWYEDNGNWRKITDVEEFCKEAEIVSVNLEALWVKVAIAGNGNKSGNNYTVSVDGTCEFAGIESLSSQATVTSVTYSWESYSWYNWNNRGNSPSGNTELDYTFGTVSSSSLNKYEKWRITASITIKLPDNSTQPFNDMKDEGNF